MLKRIKGDYERSTPIVLWMYNTNLIKYIVSIVTHHLKRDLNGKRDGVNKNHYN